MSKKQRERMRATKRTKSELVAVLESRSMGLPPQCYYCGSSPLLHRTERLNQKLCYVFLKPILEGGKGGKVEIANLVPTCQICANVRFKKKKKIISSSFEYVCQKRPNFKEYWDARTKFISDKPHICHYCDAKLVNYPFEDSRNHQDMLTIDHILPKGMGGPEANSDNFKICCSLCNTQRAKIQSAGTIEKRRNIWENLKTSRHLKEDFVHFLLHSPLELRCLV